jgi:hypothetical protein
LANLDCSGTQFAEQEGIGLTQFEDYPIVSIGGYSLDPLKAPRGETFLKFSNHHWRAQRRTIVKNDVSSEV